MANSIPAQVVLVFLFLALFHTSTTTTHASKLEKPYTSLIFTIRKDLATNLYYTTIDFQTSSYLYATLDLGGQNIWFNCNRYINVSTDRPIPCDSPKCTTLLDGKSTCTNNNKTHAATRSCAVSAYNSVTDLVVAGQNLYQSGISLDTSDGKFYMTSQPLSTFYFACSSPAGSSLFQGLAKVTSGMIGLGRSPLALPTQVTSSFELPPKFAICLPAYNYYYGGTMFIGGGPYYMTYNYGNDLSKTFTTTPLVTAPSTSEYFIDVLAIKVDGQPLHFDSSLLSINKDGVGGTKLSTISRFTVLHTSIYKAIVQEFVSKAASRKITRVASVAPYEACFSVKSMSKTRTGPRVPTIDLVLPGNMKNVVWRIYGVNSMVKANKDVLCLGFVDGGYNARTSIVLGGHQLEDNLIEFDLSTSRLSFSSSLHLHNVTCAQSRIF